MATSSVNDLVGSGYRRLTTQMSGGADKSEKDFHKWGSGKILLSADDVAVAQTIEHDVGHLLYLINVALGKLGERRLIAVWGPLERNKASYVVYLLLADK